MCLLTQSLPEWLEWVEMGSGKLQAIIDKSRYYSSVSSFRQCREDLQVKLCLEWQYAKMNKCSGFLQQLKAIGILLGAKSGSFRTNANRYFKQMHCKFSSIDQSGTALIYTLPKPLCL